MGGWGGKKRSSGKKKRKEEEKGETTRAQEIPRQRDKSRKPMSYKAQRLAFHFVVSHKIASR